MSRSQRRRDARRRRRPAADPWAAFTYPENGSGLRATLALLIDWGTAVATAAGVGFVAMLVLLVRTDWGRHDIPSGDAMLAAALTAGVLPAWAAWQLGRVYETAATFGQCVAGLEIQGPPRRRVVRFLLHPASGPLWLWAGATTLLIGGLEEWQSAVLVAAVPFVVSWLMCAVRPPRAWSVTLLDARTATWVRQRGNSEPGSD